MDDEFKVEYLIAICNNTYEFNKTIKTYQNNFIKHKYLTEQEMDANFNSYGIKKRFSKLGNLAVGKIVTVCFKGMYKHF